MALASEKLSRVHSVLFRPRAIPFFPSSLTDTNVFPSEIFSVALTDTVPFSSATPRAVTSQSPFRLALLLCHTVVQIQMPVTGCFRVDQNRFPSAGKYNHPDICQVSRPFSVSATLVVPCPRWESANPSVSEGESNRSWPLSWNRATLNAWMY